MNPLAAPVDVRQHILDTAQVIISGRGFAAVGLNEVLQAAKVPKGSFYHYFDSKEAFGEALLAGYFREYLEMLETRLNAPGLSQAQRLQGYWENWVESQVTFDPKGKCLAVKLAAEVSDLSEAMRAVLRQGTDRIIARVAQALDAAVAEGSLAPVGDAAQMSAMLYHLWLGASLRAKITRERAPLDMALVATQRMLGFPSQAA